jgi:hypothetical protein
MSQTRPLRLMLVSLALCLLVLSGCGKGGVKLKGTLVLPPGLQLNDTDSVTISFVPEGTQGPVYTGAFSPGDNSFVVNGPTSKGISPGKYKVAMGLRPSPGSSDEKARSNLFNDKVNTKYNATATKLIYEVTEESSQTITIDLAMGTIAKN